MSFPCSLIFILILVTFHSYFPRLVDSRGFGSNGSHYPEVALHLFQSGGESLLKRYALLFLEVSVS